MEEIWRDIPDYEGLYQVSNLGNVRNIKFKRTLRQHVKGIGYIGVIFFKCNKTKTFYTHQLVAMSFLNHKRNGHNLVVDHINDDKTDNRVKNLQLITQRENVYKTRDKYTSKYKGVSFCKTTNKWQSKIFLNKRQKHLGKYENEYDAHLAYQNALKNIEQ